MENKTRINNELNMTPEQAEEEYDFELQVHCSAGGD